MSTIEKVRLHVFAAVQGERTSLCRIRPPCEFEHPEKLGMRRTWSGAIEPLVCAEVPTGADPLRVMLDKLRDVTGEAFTSGIGEIFSQRGIDIDGVRHWCVDIPATQVGDMRLSPNNARLTWINRREVDSIIVLETSERDRIVTPGTLAMFGCDKQGLQACFMFKN